MHRKLLVLTVVLSSALSIVSQTSVQPSPAQADGQKLKEKAVVFLKETMGDVNSMRTLENRISFTSELASLMWFEDEKEARSMYSTVIANFRDLLLQLNDRANAMPAPNKDEAGELFGGIGAFMPDATERQKLNRKFTLALAVRQQIGLSIAEHDPDLAMTFFYESLSGITNEAFRKTADQQGQAMEFELLNLIAVKDPGKAANFGTKSLSKSFGPQHVNLLKNIYKADPDKAVEYGGKILDRLKSEKIDADDMWAMQSLIEFGKDTIEESQTDLKKKAVYTRSDLRDIAEIMAQKILDGSVDRGSVGSYLSTIEEFAPGRAVQIRAKYPQKRVVSDADDAPSVGSPMVLKGTRVDSDQTAKVDSGDPLTEQVKKEKQMAEDIQKVGNKELPAEQREAIIAQSRQILASTPGKMQKVTGLSLLAAQVAKAGDKDLAGQIMRDAETLVNPQPKNYEDFLLSWMLATGYAQAESEKAFPLLQTTILRANDTIAAFVKAAEFIDVNDEIIVDGEVQVGAFGGSMLRGLSGQLNVADSTVRVLAKADFEKTKELTNSFDRIETRVLAKMLVLRAVLGPETKGQNSDFMMLGEEDR